MWLTQQKTAVVKKLKVGEDSLYVHVMPIEIGMNLITFFYRFYLFSFFFFILMTCISY